MEHSRERDLVLPPNTFAYVLDRTKGKVSAYVGPFRSSLSDTDHLVIWENGRFVQTMEIDRAIQPQMEAAEGQYVVLHNPAHESAEKFPQYGAMNDAIDLDTGRKVVIPGPATFPLWPGQDAQVIDGHHLRHNQYLLVRVYEPEAAAANADRALVAPQTTSEEGSEGSEGATPASLSSVTMGQLIIIKGTDVSFYVPPTGIEVVPEDYDQFIREAATLEQLEYCVLLDESGRKRYERGPAVVFPQPTETFATDDANNRVFKAIELNPQSGLYIKVIAPYADDDGEHPEGEELFLTGNDTPIYFPRVEHSIIQYGDRRKHHAIAIPEGEGRYMLDRTTGEVGLVKGPSMFLPDPRKQVIVRRILAPATVAVMYPGNDEAQGVNDLYREERVTQARAAGGLAEADPDLLVTQNVMPASSVTPRGVSKSFAGERMSRGTEYTPPRTITLDTKYEGAVTVSVWPGYAVLVMDKSGHRRVEVGPVNVLLEYDESLMVLALSTGRPKTDDRKLRTPYLRTINNSVSDRVFIETRDLVPVTLDLAFRVNFDSEGDRTKWFDVEDYVALLTDHCRSKLRNLAKRHNIQEFYTQTIDLIRDALLGTPDDDTERPGLSFAENGMRLFDVEVLGVEIEHQSVEQLLTDAMDKSLRGAIELSQAQQATERQAALEGLRRRRIEEDDKTQARVSDAAIAQTKREQTQAEAVGDLSLAQVVERARQAAIERAERQTDADVSLAIDRARNEVELERLKGEVEQMIARTQVLNPELARAIAAFGDQALVERLMEAVGPVALTTGVTTADTFRQIFAGTPFEAALDALAERPFAIGRANSDE